MKLINYNLFHRDLYSRGLEYAAEHSVSLGFDGVEFLGACPLVPKILPDAEAAVRVREVLDEYGLTTACYSLGASLYPCTSEVECCFFQHAEIAAALGSPFLHHTLFLPLRRPPNAPSYNTVLSGVIDFAERIADYSAMQGVACLYEPQGVYFNGVDGLGRLLHEMKLRCNNIGVCGDFGNPFFADSTASQIFKHFAADIKHVHIKDYYCRDTLPAGKTGRETDGGKWIYDAEFGSGDVDMLFCLKCLQEVGYDGAYSLEFVGDDDTIRNAMIHFKNLHCSIFCE